MRLRSLLLPLCVTVSPLIAACDDDDDRFGGWDGNVIVFGIEQRTVPGSAEKQISAGYDYLQLHDRGGWAPYTFGDGDGDGTCYFEHLDHRLGRPRVESGVATFGGGKIAAPGLQVLANQEGRSTHDGGGWDDGAEPLTFSANGFAMPGIGNLRIYGPRVSLEVTGILPAAIEGATEVSLKTTDALSVTWKPIEAGDGPVSQVMVALTTDETLGPASQVRCFGRERSGSTLVPPEWIARLFSAVDPAKPVQGTLTIATHRQVTVLSPGGWTVYVVAEAIQREQPWVGSR